MDSCTQPQTKMSKIQQQPKTRKNKENLTSTTKRDENQKKNEKIS